MKFFKRIIFIFFGFFKAEITLYENIDYLFNIHVLLSDDYNDYIKYRASLNKIYNNPFDENYLKDIKIRTAPLTGTTSKIIYLGYPVSEFNTNSFPTTKDFGIVCLDGYNPTHYFITSSLGWILGTPKQNNPVEISSFYNNLIFGSLIGFNDNTTFNKSSYGNIIFGNQNFEKLKNDFRNSLNIIFGLSNCSKASNEVSFFGKNVINRNSFNTIFGAFNLLSGSAKSPFLQRQFYSNRFIEEIDYSNGDQSFNIIFGNSNITNVNGNLNVNKHNIVFGNYNMQGAENCHNNIVIGENNLISSRNDRNEFRKFKNNLFIGNNIFFKGLENSIDSSISNSVFIFTLKNSIDSGFFDLYDSKNFSENAVDGSIFINAFGPTKKINRSNKTYIGNLKNSFDENDFLIGVDSVPVALYSTIDNRIGSIHKNFDLGLYDKNKTGILDKVNSEFKDLKINSYTRKNFYNSYFTIDYSNISQDNFPVLSSFLVKDKAGNVIGFEPNFLIPIMVNLLNKNGKSVLVDDLEGLSIINDYINISGKTKINAKNTNKVTSLNNSNDDPFCFELFLNGTNLIKGYNTGDLTIGDTGKKLHLYGSEILLVGNGGDLKIGSSSRNSKIVLESGTNDISIGKNSTGSIFIGGGKNNSIIIDGTTSFSDGTFIGGNAVLDGTLYSDGIDINTNKFSVYGKTGNTTIGGNLNVDGEIKVNGKSEFNGLLLDGSVVINPKSEKDIIFDLFLNETNLIKGYKTGDLTIGNTKKKLHLYGSEILLVGNIGGNLNVGGEIKVNGKSEFNGLLLDGSVVINPKSEKDIIFDLFLNGTNLIKGYKAGDLTIGNIGKELHLYGSEIWLFGHGGDIKIGNPNFGSKIKLDSGSSAIEIGTYSMGDIVLGRGHYHRNIIIDGAFLFLDNRPPEIRGKMGPYRTLLIEENSGMIHMSDNPRILSVSSKRYKENIREGKVDIEKFKKLMPIIFDYIKEVNSGKKNQWGLLAEDVYDLGFEDLIEFDENDKIYGLNYQSIFVMLLSSYLDSLKKIEILEDENKKIKEENLLIEERLQKIENILVI